jgi:glycerol-3-phosphate acyltransferase PlsY
LSLLSVIAILPVSFHGWTLTDGVTLLRFVAVIVIAYLLGSIPVGYLIVRVTQDADVREMGSGGTGATNVSRRAGKAAGMVTLVLDALKGAAAVAIAELALGLPIFGLGGLIGLSLRGFGGSVLGTHAVLGHVAWPPQDIYWWVAAAAIAAIMGHIFPIWLRFRGGKGVATGAGVFLMLAPMAVTLAAVVFVVVVAWTRYVSLGSILAAVAIPLFVLAQNALIRSVAPLTPILCASVVGAALIVFAHRENIGRLIRGKENRFR